jgi:hypothetical protein
VITCICGQNLLKVKVTQVDHDVNGVLPIQLIQKVSYRFKWPRETLYYAPLWRPFLYVLLYLVWFCPICPESFGACPCTVLSSSLFELCIRSPFDIILMCLAWFWLIHPFWAMQKVQQSEDQGDTKYHCLLDIEKSPVTNASLGWTFFIYT